MTWVKICGITNLEDAEAAIEAGADALGFVFYEKSPRRISVEQARKIIGALSVDVEKVGVFVADSDEIPERIAAEVGLSATQIHISSGQSPPATNNGFKARRYLAIPVGTFFSRNGDAAFSGAGGMMDFVKHADAVFLDSGTRQQPGGTGKTFDWSAARPIAESIRDAGCNLVVAGGLTAENVTEAITTLHPWGVDVSSGVEARPGKKDPEKVRAFVKAVRAADEKSARK